MRARLSSTVRELLLLSMIPVAAAGGQTFTGMAPVDSASVARTAWSGAARAMRANDMAAARRALDRAAQAWPLQPAYTWNRALLAARVNDTGTVRQALEAYARLGLGRPLQEDSALRRVLLLPGFDGVIRQHERNRATWAASAVRLTLSDSTFWPEGIDFDARTGFFYVTSVRHGTVAEVDERGSARDLLARYQTGIGAILAARVDTARNVLWATSSGLPQFERYTAADSAQAALLRIRLADGVIERRYPLPASTRHALGDVAIGANGDVFVSDSRDPALYWLRRNADSLIRITSPLFRSLQGIAPSPGGDAVIVADYSHGLLRLSLRDGVVTWLGGVDGATPLGLDGIVWYQGGIIAIQNGFAPARVVWFQLDPTGTRLTGSRVIDQNASLADEPTIGTVAGNQFVYVANSQWEKFDDAGIRKANVRLTPPILLALPLPIRQR